MWLVHLGQSLVGHFRSGLGMVAVASETFFSDIYDSTAAIGSMTIPAMNQAGYSPTWGPLPGRARFWS